MESKAEKPLSHRPKKSGSETRRKGRVLGIRLSDEDCAPLEQAAANAGLTLASHARLLLVNAPHTRSRRRPLADVAALSGLYAQLAKSGSNLNQIAKQLNSGETVLTGKIEKTLAAHWDIICALRTALGVSE